MGTPYWTQFLLMVNDMLSVLLTVTVGYGKVYFMKSREEALENFQQFCAEIGKPRVFLSDGAPEFVGQDFKFWCRKNGIRTEVSDTCTPEEKGKIDDIGEQLLVWLVG